MHGTLDNAASFSALGEGLSPHYTLVAVELSGCGHSSWHSDGFYCMESWVKELRECVIALGWGGGAGAGCVIMGHSLGQALVSVLAGTFPELFLGAVLIEGLGWWSASLDGDPRSNEPDDPGQQAEPAGAPAPAALRRKLLRIAKLPTDTSGTVATSARTYASLDAAIDARMTGGARNPPNLRISRAAARLLVERGTQQVPDGVGGGGGGGGGGAVRFRHDPRCAQLEQYLSHAEAGDFLRRMPPTLLMHCDPALTWPSIPARSAARIPARAPPVLRVLDVAGESHHLHMDNPDSVLPTLRDWLRELPAVAAATAAGSFVSDAGTDARCAAATVAAAAADVRLTNNITSNL